jgi:hypothetical protein
MNTIEIDAQIDCIMDHIVGLHDFLKTMETSNNIDEMNKKSYLLMGKELHLSIVRHQDRLDAIKRLKQDEII